MQVTAQNLDDNSLDIILADTWIVNNADFQYSTSQGPQYSGATIQRYIWTVERTSFENGNPQYIGDDFLNAYRQAQQAIPGIFSTPITGQLVNFTSTITESATPPPSSSGYQLIYRYDGQGYGNIKNSGGDGTEAFTEGTNVNTTISELSWLIYDSTAGNTGVYIVGSSTTPLGKAQVMERTKWFR